MVIDGSISIGSCEFDNGKVALKNVLLAAHKNKRNEKYAAVTFSRSARIDFRFSQYSEAKDGLTSISYPNSLTNTQAGLAKAKELFEDSTAGERKQPFKMQTMIKRERNNRKEKFVIPACFNY